MLSVAGRSGYKPVSKYEDHLAAQIEAVPNMRDHKRDFYWKYLRDDWDTTIPRAEAAGVDFDRLWAGLPDLEPDLEAFMERFITYIHMITTIREIEAYARKLEAERQAKGRCCHPMFHTMGSALRDAFNLK